MPSLPSLLLGMRSWLGIVSRAEVDATANHARTMLKKKQLESAIVSLSAAAAGKKNSKCQQCTEKKCKTCRADAKAIEKKLTKQFKRSKGFQNVCTPI